MNLKTRRALRVEIASRLGAGETKQALYEDMKARHGDSAFLRKVIAEIPSRAARQAHRLPNHILMALLAAIALPKALFVALGSNAAGTTTAMMLLLPIGIQLMLLLMVRAYNRTAYIIVAVYGALQLMDYRGGPAETSETIRVLFVAIQLLWGAAAALAVYLYFRLREAAAQ